MVSFVKVFVKELMTDLNESTFLQEYFNTIKNKKTQTYRIVKGLDWFKVFKHESLFNVEHTASVHLVAQRLFPCVVACFKIIELSPNVSSHTGFKYA